MSEESEREVTSESNFLDWLFWYTGSTGDRFYPPDETAEEYINEFDDSDDYAKGVEFGQHARAFNDAVDLFEDARAHGLNPVERAQRYERENEVAGNDRVDWEWLEDSHYRGDVPA